MKLVDFILPEDALDYTENLRKIITNDELIQIVREIDTQLLMSPDLREKPGQFLLEVRLDMMVGKMIELLCFKFDAMRLLIHIGALYGNIFTSNGEIREALIEAKDAAYKKLTEGGLVR